MKQILFIISLFLLPVVLANAQTPYAQAYPNGIYIFCGKDTPRNFYYLIEKQDASGSWVKAAELRAPQNAATIKANLLRLPDFFLATMPLPTELAELLWERQSLSNTTDSLSIHTADPKIMAALGYGWFDDGITASGDYRYRISKVYRTDAIALGEISQRFPENNYAGTLRTINFVPEGTHITLYYELGDSQLTNGVVLYRSRLMENNYQAMSVVSAFTMLDERIVAVVHDESVAKGMAYSYVAIPRDALGNMGTPSDTVNVYNLKNFNDIGIVKSFKAIADKEKKGVMLSWEMSSDLYIHGYEIFRSKEYETGYESIVTLPAGTLSYLDSYGIDFAEAYFYYMVVNNGYGNNVPTAPTPVALEGTRNNFLPPQDLTAELHDNVVHLTFSSVKADTWGYQIFRGEGYMGELTQIASISVSHKRTGEENADNPVMVFTDTLSLSHMPQTISYAVSDVNSSYNYSPLSERVSIQYSGGMMPAPSNVDALLRGDRILVVWNDMAQIHPYISGYQLWRSVVQGETESEAQLVATLSYEQNNYMDTLVTPSKHYRYSVESIGINGESSGRSLHAGITVPQQLPLPPGQVSTLAADNRIMLRWDNPMDPSIQAIRVYRATSNTEATLLKELTADQTTFEDRTAKKGEQYYYYVVTVNNRGEESKADEPVSGRIRR